MIEAFFGFIIFVLMIIGVICIVNKLYDAYSSYNRKSYFEGSCINYKYSLDQFVKTDSYFSLDGRSSLSKYCNHVKKDVDND